MGGVLTGFDKKLFEKRISPSQGEALAVLARLMCEHAGCAERPGSFRLATLAVRFGIYEDTKDSGNPETFTRIVLSDERLARGPNGDM